MTIYYLPTSNAAGLLPAPRIAGLLPAVAGVPDPDAAAATTRVAPPLTALSPEEEALLLIALLHHEHRASQPDDAVHWLMVPPHSRNVANDLVLYGYMQKRPGGRYKRWYSLTEDGVLRAERIRERIEGGEPVTVVDHNGQPVERGDQDALARLGDDLPETARPWAMDGQQRLEYYRRRNLGRLAEELAQSGFTPLGEAGRGAHLGEQAFQNLFTGDTVIYRCRLGRDTWERYVGSYTRAYAVVATPEAREAELAALPF